MDKNEKQSLSYFSWVLIVTISFVLKLRFSGFCLRYLRMDFPDKDFLSISSASHHFLDDDELEYMSLMQYRIQPFFPHFFDALAKQSPYEREQGRCAVVHFTPSTPAQITKLENSADLQSYLGQASTCQSACAETEQPTRRLFVLEDLPCNYILALGSRLRIPPSFFAGQWDGKST